MCCTFFFLSVQSILLKWVLLWHDSFAIWKSIVTLDGRAGWAGRPGAQARDVFWSWVPSISLTLHLPGSGRNRRQVWNGICGKYVWRPCTTHNRVDLFILFCPFISAGETTMSRCWFSEWFWVAHSKKPDIYLPYPPCSSFAVSFPPFLFSIMLAKYCLCGASLGMCQCTRKYSCFVELPCFWRWGREGADTET